MNDAKTNDSIIKDVAIKIVAVDGPAGSGKSTICRLASARLGWNYVSTGKLYRAIGVLASENNIGLDDDEKLSELANDFGDQFQWDPDKDLIFYRDRNLSDLLMSENAGVVASRIAKQPKFRQALLGVQRKLARFSKNGAILDGRDIGTVVFPDADCKVYMTASLEKRARRRLKQLEEKKAPLYPSIEQLMADIEARDRQDSSRGVSPLLQADDAVFFDTSDLSLEESVDKIVDIIQKRTSK